MKWITGCWWATLTEIRTRLSYWHSLFNILHNHFFEISQLQIKPFTPCSIAAIFDSHFCLINILPIFANVWFHHLRNMNYTMRYQMRTTKVGSLQCSTLWLPNSTMKRLQHVQNATACLITLTRDSKESKLSTFYQIIKTYLVDVAMAIESFSWWTKC